LTPHPLQIHKGLLRIRSFANYENIQVRLRFNSAKFQVLH